MEAIRITQVLDYFIEPGLVEWKMRVGKKESNLISKRAMAIGTRVDEIIKTGGLYKWNSKDSKEVENCVVAFCKWKEIYEPKSITPCTRLYATINGVDVTGEPDLMVDDVLVDLKCSSKINLKYWVQVNMYRYLELYAPKIVTVNSSGVLANTTVTTNTDYYNSPTQKVGILRLDKVTASYEYVVQDYNSKFVDAWIGMMGAYLLFNQEELNASDDGVNVREGNRKEELA